MCLHPHLLHSSSYSASGSLLIGGSPSGFGAVSMKPHTSEPTMAMPHMLGLRMDATLSYSPSQFAALSPAQCPVKRPAPGNVERRIMNGRLPVTCTNASWCRIAMDVPNRLCASYSRVPSACTARLHAVWQ